MKKLRNNNKNDSNNNYKVKKCEICLRQVLF